MAAEDIAIKVENLSKDFRLPHEKAGSVKNIFTNLISYVRKSRKYEVQHALVDVSFEIKKGEFFGIVGRNGSGKSTLLKIIAGIYQPNNGSVKVNGRIVPFIELGVGFNGELTGRENVYLNGALLGFSKSEIDAMYDDIVAFAELGKFMDQKLKNYSSGMQVRLAFSLAIRAETEILLVDEVLAVGDADFQKKCFKYFRELKKNKKTVIFVSHNMNAIEEYCDRAILIEKSKVLLSGSTYKVATAYTRMFANQPSETGEGASPSRWGAGGIKYSSVAITPKELGKDDKTLTLTAQAVADKDIDEAILGFKIRGQDGTPLLGTNTKIKRQEIKNLKKGQTVSLKWEVPNVFNDGGFLVDLAIESQDYADIYDWWEEATHFEVQRSEANPYVMHPNIELKATVK